MPYRSYKVARWICQRPRRNHQPGSWFGNEVPQVCQWHLDRSKHTITILHLRPKVRFPAGEQRGTCRRCSGLRPDAFRPLGHRSPRTLNVIGQDQTPNDLRLARPQAQHSLSLPDCLANSSGTLSVVADCASVPGAVVIDVAWLMSSGSRGRPRSACRRQG